MHRLIRAFVVRIWQNRLSRDEAHIQMDNVPPPLDEMVSLEPWYNEIVKTAKSVIFLFWNLNIFRCTRAPLIRNFCTLVLSKIRYPFCLQIPSEMTLKLTKLTTNKPPRDKTNNVTVRPAKTQISLGIRPVWSESSLCAQWVAKGPSFLHADSEDSDQTGRMPRLIWVFDGRTLTLLVLSRGGSDHVWKV